MFVSYKEKQGALNALETMLITKEYHLQVCGDDGGINSGSNFILPGVQEQHGTEK